MDLQPARLCNSHMHARSTLTDRRSLLAIGTLQCVDSWLEDFRNDVARNTVPTLIIHGDADRILPPDATSRRQAKMIKHAKLAEIPGGPHGLCWTHGDRVNAELVPFVE
jgi:non-heme chloroperoxidase